MTSYYSANRDNTFFGKLSLIQVNGALNRSMFGHNKTLVISYALHTLLKQGPIFHSRPHCIMRSFSL